MNKLILSTLKDHGVDAKIAGLQQGARVDRYLLDVAAGTKIAQLTKLSEELAMALDVRSVRVAREGAHVAIEVPSPDPRVVTPADVRPDTFVHPLHIPIGQAVNGDVIHARIDKFPHLLVAGTTGSGKSNFVTGVLAHLVTTTSPADLQLMLIDPKRVELAAFAHVSHLAAPIASDVPEMVALLESAVDMMEARYADLERAGKRNIAELDDPPPYLLIVVDELADLIMTARKRAEDAIVRILQKGRAAGIHMILATQRPSVDVVTGLIKANTPSRLTFAVASHTDSSVALGQSGAQALLGEGDGLYWPAGAPKPERIQAPYLSTEELDEMVAAVSREPAPALPGFIDDETAPTPEEPDEEFREADEILTAALAEEGDPAQRARLHEEINEAYRLRRLADMHYEINKMSRQFASPPDVAPEPDLLDAAYAKGRAHGEMLANPSYASRRRMDAGDWTVAILLFLAAVIVGAVALPVLPIALGVWAAWTVTQRRTRIDHTSRRN